MSLPCLEQAVLLHLSSMHIHELPFGALVLVSRLRVYLPPYPFALTFPVHFEIYIVAILVVWLLLLVLPCFT